MKMSKQFFFSVFVNLKSLQISKRLLFCMDHTATHRLILYVEVISVKYFLTVNRTKNQLSFIFMKDILCGVHTEYVRHSYI